MKRAYENMRRRALWLLNFDWIKRRNGRGKGDLRGLLLPHCMLLSVSLVAISSKARTVSFTFSPAVYFDRATR